MVGAHRTVGRIATSPWIAVHGCEVLSIVVSRFFRTLCIFGRGYFRSRLTDERRGLTWSRCNRRIVRRSILSPATHGIWRAWLVPLERDHVRAPSVSLRPLLLCTQKYTRQRIIQILLTSQNVLLCRRTQIEVASWKKQDSSPQPIPPPKPTPIGPTSWRSNRSQDVQSP